MGRHAADNRPKRATVNASAAAGGFGPARVALAGGLILAFVLTLVGLGLLWPRGDAPEPEAGFRETQSMASEAVAGEVVGTPAGACGSPDVGRVFDGAPAPGGPAPGGPPPGAPGGPGGQPGTPPGAPAETPAEGGSGDGGCSVAIVDIMDGPDEGRRTLLQTSGMPGDPELAEGDEILLAKHQNPDGSALYAFLDMNRTVPLGAWLAVTALAIVAVAAWRGVRAIVGLAVTLALMGVFLIPALLRGGPPVALAVVVGAAILFPVMFLVHGVNWKSAAALGGTLTSLVVSAGLAHLAIGSANLRGLADDSNLLIQLYLPTVSVTGLMLAGFIVGTLGVLNDVTIAQASTVTELAEADPGARPMALFTSAMRVGRDHIASMVYTLVLAYMGAALPMTLLLAVVDRPLTQVLTSDVVATELLRSAVGALGLTLAVPVTTIIAAVTATTVRSARAARA